jgi:hypothetical protein
LEDGGDMHRMLESGDLKVVLEVYSDILVRRIRDKL